MVKKINYICSECGKEITRIAYYKSKGWYCGMCKEQVKCS